MDTDERLAREAEFVEKIGTAYGRNLLNDHYTRVHAILEGKNPPPYELEIQPAARCNANCDHCFGREYPRCEERLYTKEAMKHVIDEALNFENDGFGIEIIKFCGSTGEPLLNPQTLSAIEMAHGKRYLRLFTNAIMIGQEKNNLDYLHTISNVNRINASLDAISTEVLHDIKHGARDSGIKMEDILEGLAKVRLFGCDIEAGFAITSKNYREVTEFAKRVKEYGAANRIRYRIDVTDREVSKEHSDEINGLLDEAESYNSDDFKVIRIHSKDAVRETDQSKFGSKGCGYKCFTSRFWACVGPNGCVYPCGHVVAADTPHYGSLFELRLKKIWNGMMKKHLMASLPMEKCELCSPYSLVVNGIGDFIEKSGISLAELDNLHEKHIIQPKKAQEARAA